MSSPQLTGVVPAVCDAEAAKSAEYSRAAIIAELAAVLRDCDASVTNIESAIARAGIPMQEISAQFGAPRQLILAMVLQLSRSMAASLAVETTADLRQRLIEFGRCVIHTYASSHWRALYRIAVTESIRQTGLGRAFYESGFGYLTQRLAEFLRLAQEQGTLGPGDPHLLASHFLSPLRALVDMPGAHALDLATSPLACSVHARNVVDLFCRGINGGRQSC